MLQQLLASLDGKKTYICLLLLAAYRVVISHGWLPPMPDIETSLIIGAGLSAREAISKKPV